MIAPRRAARSCAIFAVVALQLYWYYLPAPPAMKVFTAIFAAVCIASPLYGLMLLALIAPVSTSISWKLGGIEPGGLLLEQLVLGACAGSLVRCPSGSPTRLGAPAALMAVIALVSAAAMAPAGAAATAPSGLETSEGAFWLQLLDRRAAGTSAVWAPIIAALVVAESCLLGWLAEREIRRTPALVTRLLWLVLMGHAISAVFSLDQVIGIALEAGGGLRAFGRELLIARFSPQMEVHAAGSAFVLAGIAGAGLIAGSRARRATALLLVATVSAGLWISASRPAIVAVGAAGVVAVAWWGLRSSRRRAVSAIAVAGVVIALGWFAVVPNMGRYNTTTVSVRSRLMMAETSMRLFATAPVFGIGVNQFYAASARALDPDFKSLGGYSRENAHNNFLQILAEQGVVGLAAMLWWLGLLCAGAWSATKHQGPLREHRALFLGLLACVGTWLGGHPLLVREFSTVFFLYAAILAATTSAAPIIHARIATVACAILLLSLPVRATVLRNTAELEDQGFGLSRWMREGEHRYREAGSQFQIYLPAAVPLELPLRLADGVPGTAYVEIHLGGRVIYERRIAADQWRILNIEAPRSATRFRLATVTVRPDDETPRRGPVVLVGRMIPR